MGELGHSYAGMMKKRTNVGQVRKVIFAIIPCQKRQRKRSSALMEYKVGKGTSEETTNTFGVPVLIGNDVGRCITKRLQNRISHFGNSIDLSSLITAARRFRDVTVIGLRCIW